MASSMPGLGAPMAQAAENHPADAVRQPAGPDGSHEQRLERDEQASAGQAKGPGSVEPVMIPTQRNTSKYGASPHSASESGDDTLNERERGEKTGKHSSASSSQDFVGEMGGHVDVRRGKEEFAALERKYSNMSQNSLHRETTRRSVLSRARSSRSAAPSAADIEKQQQAEMDDFNLADTLRSGRQAQDEAGIKRKAVGVAWDGLEVTGAGGMKINIRTFPNAIMEQFMMPVLKVMGLFGFNPFAGKPKTIIFPNSGVLKPGEMCLVLGRPGAGCSTFLKTIANQRDGFMAVNGDVSYAGVGYKEMGKRYAGEVVYSPEDDDHLPTLTVAQTIRFALATKTPNRRIEGVSDKQFQDDVLNLLLSMLNIKHTANTIVGNAFVRGVSGGERKRVSIAEMFCAGPVVASWDNSTRGLDASTALDYAKSLRLLTDIMQQTTFVSLYQAGEGIYDQFDKVLVLNDGHVVYYGPSKEARPYMLSLGFRDLPRQTTADYLTGCTDVNERQFADGRSADNVPSTPEAMEQAFLASDIHRREMDAKAAYQELHAQDAAARDEFKQAVQDQKHRGVPKKSPYTVSFLKQIAIITKRQTTLKFQDKFGIYTGYATSIAIALIVGSLFFQLPQTAAGIFTRGGLLFIGLLFPALNAFSELPGQMMGRPILYRQSGYKFFRPAAFAVAAVLSDIPYNLSSIFLFSIILYFMGGLYVSAGAYFTYLLFTFLTFMTMASFFRTLGVGTKDYNVAARLASVLISIMVTYTGYMIPVYAMKRWLFWLFYLNPLGYGYSAIFANEFHRVDFTCDGNYILPRNVPEAGITGFNTDGVGANQLCSVPGSVPGQNIISGDDYMAAAFEYSYSHVWRNFGILIGFLIFFIVLQMILVERMAANAASAGVVVFKKEDKETKELNKRLLDRREDFNAGKLEQDVSGLGMAPSAFTWSRLSYTVPVKGGQRQLLSDVWGYVKPGSLTALMGASGAGKTTLLDVLADRKTTGVISGEINMGGKPIDTSFQRGCGYAEQQDVHEWTSTVREAFRFSAYLRQPQSVPVEEKNAYCEDILELLELQDLADAMIGMPGYGLSVEARKRVTIGVELAAKPDLLLFLDEPTSGLDGQSAYNVVRFLQKLCDAGQKILCTIHQPNALLFQSFHRLLLLQRGGECVYFGDIGHDAKTLAAYLERNGAPVPGDINVAEYMLEAIGAGSRKRIGGDWAEKWRNSPEFEEVKKEVERLNKEGSESKVESTRASTDYATSFGFQLKTVLMRTNVALWRNADYQWTRLFAHIAIALVVGLTFLQLDNSLRSLQYRVFAIFFTSILPALILAQIEYLMSRMTFVREASSKMYSSTVFASTQLLSEMPYSVLCATAFFLLLWYTVGLPSESGRAGVFFALVLITEIYSVTLGQLVAALSPTIIFAALWNPFILVVFTSFAGVVSPPAALPHFWRAWLYPLNPFSRLISAAVSTALYNVPVICEDAEYNLFSAPDGQSCGAYAGAFAEAVGGYLGNPDAVGESCQFCQYSVGQSFYAPLSIDFNLRGRDIGIYICYIVFNSLCLLLAARFLSYTRR